MRNIKNTEQDVLNQDHNHALLKRMNEVIGLDGTVDLQKTNKIQEGDRLNIQKMVDLINVQYIGSVRYYWVDPEVPLGFSLIS